MEFSGDFVDYWEISLANAAPGGINVEKDWFSLIFLEFLGDLCGCACNCSFVVVRYVIRWGDLDVEGSFFLDIIVPN